ncbi:hypothetical protein Taro_010168 [Colocasia esculenta]|uniref:Retrotransposon gag domain-containing protein n=1 Tax=Colocasia esculenta TaxID=4460 RepID=A0A843U2I5_COLES|nr:hypothetical protein [Colocasia esculenta]
MCLDMASRGRRGVPARDGEQRSDEPRREDQGEKQAPAPQGPERADVWWSSLLRTRFEDGAVEVGWDEFVRLFRAKFVPEHIQDKMEQEFLSLCETPEFYAFDTDTVPLTSRLGLASRSMDAKPSVGGTLGGRQPPVGGTRCGRQVPSCVTVSDLTGYVDVYGYVVYFMDYIDCGMES